jgi:hypothetical protein
MSAAKLYRERLTPVRTAGVLLGFFGVADYSGDDSYRLAAEAHADMTAKAFIRADDSTYHAVEYDVTTGERKRGYTFQGASDESAWSRGQGWAIYGYVNSARETGKRKYLDLAERLATYLNASKSLVLSPKRVGDRLIASVFEVEVPCADKSFTS